MRLGVPLPCRVFEGPEERPVWIARVVGGGHVIVDSLQGERMGRGTYRILGLYAQTLEKRAESKHSKDSHDDIRKMRFGRYRLMLLICGKSRKTLESAAPREYCKQSCPRAEIPESPRDGSHQKCMSPILS